MSKDPSPLLGYNNNIRHKNRVFHVQTEDSGVRHPHIITHLFMDGGRILKSVKTSYADHLGADKMADTVRQMMKDQHKAMLMGLRDGQYDHLVEGGAAKTAGKAAVATAPTERAMPTPTGGKTTAAAPKARGRSVPPPPVALPPDSEPPVTTRNPNPPEELTLDIEALERAAAEAPAAMFQPEADLPPPPANLFRERTGGGGYRAVGPAPTDKVHPTSRPPASAHRSPPPSRARGASSRPPPPVRRGATPRPPPPSNTGRGSSRAPARPKTSPPASGTPVSEGGRYAPARPAAIFGQSKPQRGNSIFGEDLISDKSLDEVILSYLAEDLETPTERKKK
jgi:hypothetical protein